MTNVTLKKINHIKVHPPVLVGGANQKKIKGSDMFSELYANIYIAARKKSGKSVAIMNILKHCVGRDTTVFFIVPTILRDPTYQAMIKTLDNHGINHIEFTSIKEGGVDNLQELIDSMDAKLEEDKMIEAEEKHKKPVEKHIKGRGPVFMNDDDDEDDDKPKKKRPTKYIASEYFLIFDDISDELKSRSLETFMKMNRHYKAKIILSSQSYNDLLPAQRKQIDYMIIFPGLNEEKLKILHRDANVHIDFEEFFKIYKFATAEKYNFLYVDCVKSEFRKNFNIEINID
jgi:hypothetical protein